MEKFRLAFSLEVVDGVHSDFLNNFLVGLHNDYKGTYGLGVQSLKLLLVGLEGLCFFKETKDISFCGKKNNYF